MYGGMRQDLRFGGLNRESFAPTHIVDHVNTPAQVARQKEAAEHSRRIRRTLEQQGEGQKENQPKNNMDGTRSNDPAAELRKMLGIDSAKAGPTAGFHTAQTGGARTRGQAASVARQQSTRSGQVPRGAVDAGLKSLSLKDKRHSLQSRQKEAMRRLNDVELDAGKPGDNLCRLTGPKSAQEQTGKRPWFYDKRRVGRAANALCGPVVEEAFSNEKFLKEQELVCGKDREYVYPYKRGGKKVTGHCRELAGPTTAKVAKNRAIKQEKLSAASTPPVSHSTKTQIPKGTTLSDSDKAKIKGYGTSLNRGDKKRMVARVRIYMLQGMSFEDAKDRAEGRDVVAGPMRTTKKKANQSKPRSSRFIDTEADASDEEGSDEDEETEADQSFIDDEEQATTFGPMTAAR
eukprot:COSAG02_NODE_4818_length_4941_cov_1.653862_4_plen_403_part_00